MALHHFTGSKVLIILLNRMVQAVDTSLAAYTPDCINRSSRAEPWYFFPMMERKFSAMWKPSRQSIVLENSSGNLSCIYLPHPPPPPLRAAVAQARARFPLFPYIPW